MEEISEKDGTNGFWRRLSSAVNKKNMANVTRSVTAALVMVFACRRGGSKKDGEVYTIPGPKRGGNKSVKQNDVAEFRYPDNRFLTNAEIGTQLLLLEDRFRKQSEILRKHRRQGIDNDYKNKSDERFKRMVDLVEKIQLRNDIEDLGPDGLAVFE